MTNLRHISLSSALLAVALAASGAGLDLLSRASLREARQRQLAERGPVRLSPGASAVAASGAPARIGAFIRLNPGHTADDLRAEGVDVLSVRGDIALCMVPLDSAESISMLSPVHTMQIARRVHTHTDRGLPSAHVTEMHSGSDGLTQAYTGKGVVAGVVDQGVDPNHMAFTEADGTPRLGYVYTIDYANNANGWADKGYWGNDIKKFTTDTKYGYHGTHTLGILGGNYRGKLTMPDESRFESRDKAVPIIEADSPFHGSAPGADLCAAACADLNDLFIANGVDQLTAYAYDRKSPAVISMSLGSNIGPHDPRSLMNHYLDLMATKSADNPNPAILVLSAGNEGDRRICLRKTLKSTDDMLRTFVYPTRYRHVDSDSNSVTARQDRIVIYSSDTTRLEVQAIIYNAKRSYNVAARMPVIGEGLGAYYLSDIGLKVTENDAVNSTLAKYFYGVVGLGGILDEETNRYYAMLDYQLQNLNSTNADDNYVLGFQVKVAPGSKIPAEGINVECYCSGETTEMSDYGQTTFDCGSRNGSISDMAVGPKLIVVGSYNTRKEWLCLDGYASRHEWATDDYFGEGLVSGFSSFGTLRDGRNLPTVCAPGSTIISAVSRYFSELDEVKDMAAQYYQAKATDASGRVNYWKQELGTSMSTPLVAGAIACWLEADPTLTYADVQDIIRATATVDDDVRRGDSVQWGAGKFNALAGLKEVIRRRDASAIGSISADDASGRLIITPAGDRLYTLFVGSAKAINAEVYTLQGARVMSLTTPGDEATIDLSTLSPGVYALRVNGISRKLALR